MHQHLQVGAQLTVRPHHNVGTDAALDWHVAVGVGQALIRRIVAERDADLAAGGVDQCERSGGFRLLRAWRGCRAGLGSKLRGGAWRHRQQSKEQGR